MQPITSYDRLIYGAPGLFLGFIVGYFVGGSKSLTIRDRFLIGIAFILIGGAVFILALGVFIPIGTFEVGLSIFKHPRRVSRYDFSIPTFQMLEEYLGMFSPEMYWGSTTTINLGFNIGF